MLKHDAVLHFASRPVEFAKELIGVTPDPIQGEIMQAVAANPLVSVRSGHGVGKSAMQSWLIIWFMCTRAFPKVPCTAPTKHQLYDILWAEVAKWLGRNPALKRELVWTYEKLYMKGYHENWFAVPRTASKPDALQGFHADDVLYVIDEASGVADSIFEPVLGALSTEGAKLLMCGNPTQLSGFFYESHHKNRSLYQVYKVSSADSPRVSEGYVQMIIDMFGEDSDVYKVRVAGEFPSALPDSFISLEWVERCSHKSAPKQLEPAVISIGVDVARFGDDESVICPVFDYRQQQQPQIIRKNDTMQITGAVAQLVRSYRQRFKDTRIEVKVDCDGLGVGVFDRLHELKSQEELFAKVELYELHFGGRGGQIRLGDPVEYSNTTGLMWGAVREALRNEELTLVYDAELIAQLTNRKYSLNSAGRIELERKEAMKKRGLRSPDRADALALAMYRPRSGFSF